MQVVVTKHHGLGNDFLVLETSQIELVTEVEITNWSTCESESENAVESKAVKVESEGKDKGTSFII